MTTRGAQLALLIGILALAGCVQAAGRPTSVGTAATEKAPEQPAGTN